MIKKLVQRMLIVSFAVMLLFSSLSTVYGANMSVYNDPPSFVEVKIIDSGERIQIVVDVKDMNGWEDIRKVYVNTTDSKGNIVESALFTQKKVPDSYRKLLYTYYNFSNIIGNSLLPDESIANASNPPNVGPSSPDWFKAVHERINFVFKPFSAYYVHITAFDRKMNRCEYSGPFSSEYQEPPMIENPVVPLGISLVIASATGAGVYVHRRHSNKMAQLVEEKMGGG